MTEKKLKRLVFIKRLLLVIIIAYVVVFVLMNTSYLSVDNMRRFAFSAKTAIIQTSASKNDSLTYHSGDIPSFLPFKDGIAVLNETSLSVYSADNIRFSTHTVNLRNPVLRASDGYILCYDRGGKKLFVFNSFDLLLEKEFSDVIINASVDDQGRIAVITERYGYKGLLTVFSTSFEERFQWYSADTYIIDAFFTSKNTVSVVTIAQKMENINTVVYTLNYSAGEERSAVVANNAFPLSVAGKSDGSVEIVSEEGLVSFRNGGSHVVYSYGSLTPYKFYQGDKYTVLAFNRYSHNDTFSVCVTDITGNIQFETTLQSVRDVSAVADTILVLTSDRFLAFDRTGEIIAETTTVDGVIGIVPGRQKIVLYGAEKAYIYSISDILK